MTDATPEQALSEAASVEHIHAQSVATEAAEKARAAQIREIMQESDERMARIMTKALTEVFGPEDTGAYANIVRIPLICQDISALKKDVASINGNITWGVRIVIAAVVAGLLAILFK